MNKVNILFFATLKEKAGLAKTELVLPDTLTVADLKKLLFERFPNLPQSGSSMLVAVNKEYAFDQEEIPQGAEIALFPPVSGG
jgi:molybdopterin converting factor subunit 1